MKRILSVWLPELAIERWRRARASIAKAPSLPSSSHSAAEEAPFALVASEAHGQRIAALTRAARLAGVRAGMALADARAICPRLATEPADAAADAALLARLALWASRYGPLVARDDPDGLFLDVTGCAHLFGGEAGLLADLAARLEKAGFTCRLAVAGTPLAAAALARFVRGANSAARIAPPAETRARLAPLPVGALRLDGETALLLERLGLKTIGALSEIPRAALERRFRSRAQGAHVLARLDEAFGRKETPLVPVRPLPLFSIRILYPEPALESLAVETGTRSPPRRARPPPRAGRPARAASRSPPIATDGTAQSLGDRPRARLSARARPHRAPLQGASGAPRSELRHRRASSLPPSRRACAAPAQAAIEGEAAPSRESLARLVDRLANRLPGETRRPARPAGKPCARARASPLARRPPSRPGHLLTDEIAPSALFARPEPMTAIAEIPDGPPLSFTWRRLVRARARGARGWSASPLNGGATARARPCATITRSRTRTASATGSIARGSTRGLCAPEGPRWYVHGLFG
ncbi:MAG: DNA polymerase Y family protein [Alphaproteobacteria bacterium]|nr:DNA polymerase Y family protein [Alphaproteobacteria bacterium]